MFTLGNSLFACGVRSARERSFEEARGETEVGRRRLPPPLALAPWTRPASMQTNLNQRPPRALFCLKLDNSWCYARYSCGNNCNVVVKLVQEYHCFFIHFTSVLRKQFAANDMFLKEANSYKRTLALRNSRLNGHLCTHLPRALHNRNTVGGLVSWIGPCPRSLER